MSDKTADTWVRHLDTRTRSVPGGPAPVADLRVPGLTILAHPDSRRVGERVALPELGSGKDAALSRLEPLFSAPEGEARRPLADPYLSRHPIRLRSAPRGAVRLECGDSKSPLAVDGAAVSGTREISAEDLERGAVLLLAERVALLLHLVAPSPPRGVPRFGMVGDSPALLETRREIARVADLDVPVLLLGETGCGKELAAAAIHQAGARKSRPYLAVNMGAVPASLAASELFGAGRGAFTGADRKRAGYFSRADGGTLFLDEIGEAPPEVQVLLLRVLETGEIQPVGSEEPRRVDVRVIAATDADLEARAAAGSFRAPLLHRLGGHRIRLPPLCERRDDLGRLLVHFLGREMAAAGEDPGRLEASSDTTPWLPAALVARLAACSWPGNVRQLKNVARQLVVSSRGLPRARLTPQIEEQLDSGPVSRPDDPRRGPAPSKAYRSGFEVGEEELVAALRANRWRVQPTAVRLGISRSVLYSLIESSAKVRQPRDLGREEIEACRERCGGNIEAMVEELEVSRKGLRRRMTELGLP